MKILLFGATGRSGKLILQKALADGHKVTAIVRDASDFSDSKATIVEGSPYDAETVELAMKDCDAVICTLNISRVSDNPWAKLRSPEDLISKSISNALAAMKKSGVKRVITLSVIGIDDPKSLPFIARLFLFKTNIKYAMWDHARQEKVLAASDVDWTAIRLPMLTDKGGEAKVLVNMNDDTPLKSAINRQSLSRFVLDILSDSKYYQKIIAVSNA